MRKSHDSHVSGIGVILILNDPAPSLNAVSCDKKSASVRQADGVCGKLMARQILTRFGPDKKICSSTTKNRLVCGSLYAQTTQLPAREMVNDFVQNNIPYSGYSIIRRIFPHMQIAAFNQ